MMVHLLSPAGRPVQIRRIWRVLAINLSGREKGGCAPATRATIGLTIPSALNRPSDQTAHVTSRTHRTSYPPPSCDPLTISRMLRRTYHRPSPNEPRMDHFAIVTAFGQDRPGIVALMADSPINSAATSKTPA